MAREQRRQGGRVERRDAGDHFIQDAAEAVEIAARIELAAGDLLGAHVERRADHEARFGECTGVGLTGERGRQGARDAEVAQHRMAAVQEDVLGLDVAVHETGAVCIVERVGHLDGQAGGFGPRHGAVPREVIAQRLAHDVRHHVVEPALELARVVHLHDVRMAEPRRHAYLAQESLGANGRGQPFVQDLDRDLAVELEVVREVDGGRAASPELALDGPAPGEGRGSAGEVAVGHGRGAVGMGSG